MPLEPEFELGPQAGAQGIVGQQVVLDLDARLLLEGGTDLVHQHAVPGAVVADEDELLGLRLGAGRAAEGGEAGPRHGAGLQELSPAERAAD